MANWNKINSMGKDALYAKNIPMMGPGKKENLMVMEWLIILQGLSRKVFIEMARDLVKDRINLIMVNHILEILRISKEMDLEPIISRITSIIKESGKIIYNMERGSNTFRMEVGLLELGFTIKSMGKARTSQNREEQNSYGIMENLLNR